MTADFPSFDAILLEALYARIMALPRRSVKRARLEERARLIRHGMLG